MTEQAVSPLRQPSGSVDFQSGMAASTDPNVTVDLPIPPGWKCAVVADGLDDAPGRGIESSLYCNRDMGRCDSRRRDTVITSRSLTGNSHGNGQHS